MKIAAIICEYDPFHNGHAYHIARTRAAGCDRVVCIMDGHLTQRGELAALSKWDRARAALMNGADAVIELPSLFACRSADVFARAGVKLAHAVGADVLSFGSECEDITLLNAMAAVEEDAVFKKLLAEGLERGESHPRARMRALRAALGRDDLPEGPNAILATEYIRALNAIGEGAPKPLVIRREGEYHSRETGGMASASAIRAAVRRGDIESADEALPENARFQTKMMISARAADDMYLYALRMKGAQGTAGLPDVVEGLENRVCAAARSADTLEGFIDAVKCKRYTRARLMRLASHALTGLTAELAAAHPAPEYIRVLGARSGDIVSELARRARLPMFSQAGMRGDPVFTFENTVTDIWALTRGTAEERRAGREMTERFIKI